MAGKIKQLVFAEGVAVVAPTEVDIVDTVNDQTIAGTKTFDEQIVLKEIATPTTPASGYKAVYPKADGKMYTLDDTGIETEIGSGSGGGGINYIDNPDAEGNVTTGWAVYADAAATTPVDGTGGTANITFTASSSSPLRGTYSFLITKDAANRQGQGASYDFTIAAADKGRPLGIRWEGEASANYTGSSGTEYMVCYVYDVTNATVIATSNVNVPGGSFKGFTTFLATTSTSYRLIFHIAGTGTAAWTYKLDSVSVGPDTVVQGAAVSDWVASPNNPTVTGITVGGSVTYSGYGVRERRVGDSIEAEGSFTLATVTTAPTGFIKMSNPFSGSIDSAKVISSTGMVGYGNVLDASTSENYQFQIYWDTTNGLYFAWGDVDTNGDGTPDIDRKCPITLAAGDIFRYYLTAPIVGWSSNVTMANRAVEEYLYNTNASIDQADTTSFGYGASGTQVLAHTATSGVTWWTYRVRSTQAVTSTDLAILELKDSSISGSPWVPASSLYPPAEQSTSKYGFSLVQVSSTDFDVRFGKRGMKPDNATLGGTGTVFANTLYWRVRIVRGGASVGFPVSTRNIVGDTSGTTVPSGYIGETITATITAGAVGTSEADITGASLALGAGVWLVCYSLSVYAQTGAVASNASYISACLTDSSNNHVTNSERLQSAKTVAAVANYVEGCLASNSVINLSAAATYKLRARRVDVAGTGTAGVYMTSPTNMSSFFAIRIA